MKKIKRDIGAEILTAIAEIKQGKGKRTFIETNNDVTRLRSRLDLTQASFANLMGINLRTLQGWEQGRRRPTGAAISLLKIVSKHPEIFANL